MTDEYCRKEYMLVTLEMMRQNYGGAEAYVRSHCGLTKDDVERIRQNIVVQESPKF